MKPRSEPPLAQTFASGCPAAKAEHPQADVLDLAGALGQPAADRRIDILRRIGAGGSIAEAARGAGVSYRAAWQAIETLGNLAGQALVEKVVGGSGGGGARLTAAGERVLTAAERLEAARRAVLSSDADAMPGLSLRTSLRNLLRCRVRSLQDRSGLIMVALETAGGDRLASSITLESSELLGLKEGLPVLALFKATAVRIEKQRPSPDGMAAADQNLLVGHVARGVAQAGGEGSLQLAGGERITGFADAALTEVEPASARFPSEAVVIALA